MVRPGAARGGGRPAADARRRGTARPWWILTEFGPAGCWRPRTRSARPCASEATCSRSSASSRARAGRRAIFRSRTRKRTPTSLWRWPAGTMGTFLRKMTCRLLRAREGGAPPDYHSGGRSETRGGRSGGHREHADAVPQEKGLYHERPAGAAQADGGDQADVQHRAGLHRRDQPARRRHRHHEHHARLGHRADAGDRHPPGHRGQAQGRSSTSSSSRRSCSR